MNSGRTSSTALVSGSQSEMLCTTPGSCSRGKNTPEAFAKALAEVLSADKVVKQFEEETNARAMIVLDVSASMQWTGAPGRLTKLAYAERLAAAMALLLLVFFCGFNALEATQPSLASRIAPRAMRGTAMGVYNTLQSLGFFAGGVMGGQLVKSYGTQGLFLTCAALMVLWLVVAWPMVAPKRPAHSAKTP